jgi:hypothetical protein
VAYALLLFTVALTGAQLAFAVDANAPILWRDPGDVAKLDLAGGPAGRDGAPAPPFVFREEEFGGTSAKVLVKDANKRTWSVKWGEEVKSEVFATRLLWAVGYITEPSYYVKSGHIDSVGALTRAKSAIDSQGNFHDARFELRDPKYYPVRGENWTFKNIARFPQFTGLKIMLMLVSNWDVKDARSSDPDTNTAVMKKELDNGGVEIHYMINDWGATMGRWGAIATRSKWDCKGYAAQTKNFVKGVKNDFVEFGWEGKRADDIAKGIRAGDVPWLMLYLGKLTDEQIRAALEASGATAEETQCFGPAVRDRIEQLRKVSERAQ